MKSKRQCLLHVFRAKDGWRWRLRASNSKIIADSGESYTRRRNAVRAAKRLEPSLTNHLLLVDK